MSTSADDRPVRLILGFDPGCATCSDLAERLESQVGDRLELRRLRERPVAQWREQALGGNPVWAPTLIEVSADGVRAWTGLRMAVQLSKALGLSATLRLVRTLGEAAILPRNEK